MKLKKILSPALFIFIFFIPFITNAVTVHFDDLPSMGASSGVLPLPPATYGGLQWSGAWRYITPNTYAPTFVSGYPGGATSLPNALLSDFIPTAPAIYSSTPFDFTSAKVKAAWRDNLQ